MDERSFFDRLAPTWDANEVMSTPERVNDILDKMTILPGQRVLDLGTGTGVLIPYIAKRVGADGHITAVDYSEGMLALAKEKYSHLQPSPEFINADFETENISGIFDRIILYCVYPHLHAPVDTLRWLRTVNLAEGGKIFIAFPSGPNFINNIHRERHSESDILPPVEVLAEELRKHGLSAKALSSNDESYIIEITK